MKALDMLKNSASKDALILIIDDESAKKVLFAWTNLFPSFTDFDTFNHRPDGDLGPINIEMPLPEVIDRAWQGITEEQYEKLARIAGLPRRTVEDKVMQLSRARLIFPDGTASEYALKMIEAEIAGKARKLLGRQTKREEQR
jgi:hypothetical protein